MKFSTRLRGMALVLVVAWAAMAPAADWSAKSAELARAIAGAGGAGSITLAVVNASSLPKDQVTEIQRAIEAQLRASGVRVGSTANANSDVRVTLSENLHDYVWVAEIKQGNDTRVEMVTSPRSVAPSTPKNGATVSVRKVLMWSQATQMLDMLIVDGSTSNPKMVVLDVEAISLYALREGKWQREQTWAITHTRAFPRNVRGLLVVGKDKLLTAYLRGRCAKWRRSARMRSCVARAMMRGRSDSVRPSSIQDATTLPARWCRRVTRPLVRFTRWRGWKSRTIRCRF